MKSDSRGSYETSEERYVFNAPQLHSAVTRNESLFNSAVILKETTFITRNTIETELNGYHIAFISCSNSVSMGIFPFGEFLYDVIHRILWFLHRFQ
jgi:hypothetical protein